MHRKLLGRSRGPLPQVHHIMLRGRSGTDLGAAMSTKGAAIFINSDLDYRVRVVAVREVFYEPSSRSGNDHQQLLPDTQ